MKRAILPFLLVLAACGPSAEQPPANRSANRAEPAAAEPQAAPVPPLTGEWTITQINGQAPRQVWPMVARATDNSFTISSECRRFGWRLRQNGNLVQFTPDPGLSADCPRVRSPAELQIEKAVGLANIAMFSGQDAVELNGPGGRVTMTRR